MLTLVVYGSKKLHCTLDCKPAEGETFVHNSSDEMVEGKVVKVIHHCGSFYHKLEIHLAGVRIVSLDKGEKTDG